VSDRQPAFGDQVRVRSTAETLAAGVAGLEGEVHGFTTPSVTGVEVIGSPADDHALHVWFGDDREGRWFHPDLLELLHHNVGMEIKVKGSSVKSVRNAAGGWDDVPVENRGSVLKRLLSWLRRGKGSP
jgi:hypothetical protein